MARKQMTIEELRAALAAAEQAEQTDLVAAVAATPGGQRAKRAVAAALVPAVEVQYPTLAALKASAQKALGLPVAKRIAGLDDVYVALYEHFVQTGVSTKPEGKEYDGGMVVVLQIPKQIPNQSGMTTQSFSDAFTALAEMLGFPSDTGKVDEKGRKIGICRFVTDRLVDQKRLKFGFTRGARPMPKIWSTERAASFKAEKAGASTHTSPLITL